jgi:hypothetical protein
MWSNYNLWITSHTFKWSSIDENEYLNQNSVIILRLKALNRWATKLSRVSLSLKLKNTLLERGWVEKEEEEAPCKIMEEAVCLSSRYVLEITRKMTRSPI